MLNYPMEEL